VKNLVGEGIFDGRIGIGSDLIYCLASENGLTISERRARERRIGLPAEAALRESVAPPGNYGEQKQETDYK
jgi:hypothetical protein